MTVRKQAAIWLLALAFALVGSGSAFAKNSRKVNLGKAVTIHGTQLAPGNYQVSWETHSPEATVTFTHKKAVVATAEGKLVERPTKYENDSVVYSDNDNGSRTIIEIRFAGSNQVLTFNES
jgi:hypothetical protein